MKKFIVAFALLIGIASFNNKIEAQNISISINIGHQPAWGPVGYDYVGYYYFPDIDCYYDVNMSLFYYFDRGRWISARYLPYAYRHYDLYRLYKVVLNTHNPWRYHYNHYRDYARYRGHYNNQIVIRDSRDHRYYNSRNNKVNWYSKKQSQRDYKYNYNNYNYNGRNNNSYSNHNNRNNSNQPKRDYNYNNSNRNNNNNNKKFDSSRNNENKNKNNDRSNYNSNRSSNSTKNNDRGRSSVNSSRSNKENKSTRSSSGNGSYRLTSNERSSRR